MSGPASSLRVVGQGLLHDLVIATKPATALVRHARAQLLPGDLHAGILHVAAVDSADRVPDGGEQQRARGLDAFLNERVPDLLGEGHVRDDGDGVVSEGHRPGGLHGAGQDRQVDVHLVSGGLLRHRHDAVMRADRPAPEPDTTAAAAAAAAAAGHVRDPQAAPAQASKLEAACHDQAGPDGAPSSRTKQHVSPS